MGFSELDFDPYERYLDFETGVLQRILSRIYLAEMFVLGSHIGKNDRVSLSSQIAMFTFWKRSKTGFVP